MMPDLSGDREAGLREALGSLVDALEQDAAGCRKAAQSDYNNGRDSAYANAAYRLKCTLDANPPAPSGDSIGEKLLGEEARLGAFEALQASGIYKSVDEHQEEYLWQIVDACVEGLVAAALQPDQEGSEAQ